MDEYIKASVNGIPLVVVVLGLVQWFKDQGIPKHHLRIYSLGVGFVLGVAYQASMLTPETTPVTTAAYYAFAFGAIIYGLGLGLVASGLYDTADTIFKKAVGR